MDPAPRRRHTPRRFSSLPRWFVTLVMFLLIPAYTVAAVVDLRAPIDAATAELDAADAASPFAVDLTGEHSDTSDDAHDHVADTVPHLPPAAADTPWLALPSAPPPARAPDTLLRPPSART